MPNFDFIDKELKDLKEQGLYRELKTIQEVQGIRGKVNGKEVINFCSNNYLGLASHPKVIEATENALKKYGVGSGASRLVSGNFDIHEELESSIAKYEGTESSIVFPTGYMANLGTIQALVGEGDAVIVDRLDHASIIDGARLSGAKLLVYPHKDMEQLEKVLKKAQSYKKRLIVSDHVFSMDGDIAPTAELIKLAEKYDAMLMLDVAHSIDKVKGQMEKGKSNVDIIIMGTLSKTIGSLGGYIAGPQTLIDYLRNKARAYIYTTALPPAIAAASIAAYEVLEKDDTLKLKLWDNVKYAKSKLSGYDTLASQTQIIPVLVGDAKKASELSSELFNNGIFLSAIRPPTVPKGTSRLRLTVTAMHSKEDIDKLADSLDKLTPPILAG
jgi:8-amino-7-oxononanoate synthase